MAMIGGILGAGAGLAGAALQAQAQQTANIINYMNLQFQKRNADKQMRFSQAARGDAYGNKQKYDELLNEWIMSLTPTQNQIIKAGEKEQLLSLTEDAKRNRDILRQQRERGLEAGKDYNRVLASFRYGGPKSEIAMRDELTNLLAGVTRENAYKNRGQLVQAAMREGRGGTAANIRKSIEDQMGQTLAGNMLQAKAGAAQDYATRTAAHTQQHLPVLQELQRLMDMGGGAQPRFSDTPQQLAGLQQQQFQGIQGAYNAQASQVGGAYGKLAESMGKAPDLSGVAKSLGAMGQGMSKENIAQQRYAQQQQGQQQPYYSLPSQGDGQIEDDRFTNSYNEEFG